MNTLLNIAFCCCFYCLGAALHGKVGPQNILDAALYQSQKDLDNAPNFLGSLISKRLFLLLSEKDKYLTLRLLDNALETSPSYLDTKWNNLDNQHRGSILVYPVEEIDGNKCRKFLVRFHINDESSDIYGRSCRINQTWKVLE